VDRLAEHDPHLGTEPNVLPRTIERLILDRLQPALPSSLHRHRQASAAVGLMTALACGLAALIAPSCFERVSVGAVALAVLTILLFGAGRYLRAAHARALEAGGAAERDRIARDLHDTLIQSINGLILEIQSYAGELTPQNSLRLRFEAALDRASSLLDEARDRVSNLRSATQRKDLPSALRDLVHTMQRPNGPAIDLEVKGSGRGLCESAAGSLYDVAREALINAQAHARAKRITLTLALRHNGLSLSIRDDGIGISPGRQFDCSPQRHFGLRGMRERADRLGASLTIANRYPQGTEVTIEAFAADVYRDECGAVTRNDNAAPAQWRREIQGGLRGRPIEAVPSLTLRSASTRRPRLHAL
jgi:signal transduction histidine kinase